MQLLFHVRACGTSKHIFQLIILMYARDDVFCVITKII